MDPDIKHPRTDELSLGFERALSNDVRVSVTGIYRDNKNLHRLGVCRTRGGSRNLTSPAGDGLRRDHDPVPLDELRGLARTTWSITNPDGFQFTRPRTATCSAPSTPSKRYKALMVVVNKRFSHRWVGQVSYVLSKSYGTSTTTASLGRQQLHQRRRRPVPVRDAERRPRQRRRRADQQPPPRAQGDGSASRCRGSTSASTRTSAALSGRPYTAYQQLRRLQRRSASCRFSGWPPRAARAARQPAVATARTSWTCAWRRSSSSAARARTAWPSTPTSRTSSTPAIVTDRPVPGAEPGRSAASTTVVFGSPTALIAPRQTTLGARWSF